MRLTGLAAGGVLLNACQPVATPISGLTPTSSPTVAPSLSPTMSPTLPPTATLTPTATATPTNTPSPAASPTPTLTPEPTNTPAPAHTPTPTETPGPPTLRELADAAGIEFGCAITKDLFDTPDNKKYLGIFQRDFNYAVVHVGLSWDYYEQKPEVEDQGSIWFVGRQIEALHSIGIFDIRGHVLVYPRYSPQWLRDGVKRGEINREQLIAHMKRHITSLAKQWRGKFTEWIVVTEPYRHQADDDDFFQTVIGDEYIDIAFETAKEADPSATLIFEDTFNHASRGYNSVWNVSEAYTTEQTRSIVKRLKEKDLIDGVGLEMQLDGANPPDKQDVIATMQSYGVAGYATSLTVDLRNVRGTQQERFTKQAQVFADSLDACFQSAVCKTFSFWDIGDRYSWLENPAFNGSPDADPTPFDDNLEPKPAYYALYNVLSRYALAR